MPPSDRFTVNSFTEANLFDALSVPPCSIHDISQNEVAKYLFAYLGAIGVNTIVVELDYVDADYLDDYANFYAKSFEPIPKRCRRLHFFTTSFDSASFLDYVVGVRSHDLLQESYAGFVVARPLPTATLGRTVLATYPSDAGRRHYPTTRTYHVNLFGMGLQVESLAFQMQDTSLAACATVALWSCFQKTQDIFKSLAPTPVAITRAANRLLASARPFPSRGLQVQQICNAIAAVGLDPEVYSVTPSLPLASLVYSYLRLGLPVLALVKIPNLGGHAIALTGYSMRDTQQLALEGGAVQSLFPKLIGSRIDEFYAHDDQKGPFRRLRLNSATGPDSIVTFRDSGWPGDLVPEFLIIPVYPKIRTGFREVSKYLLLLSTVAGWVCTVADFEWDVYLTSANDFKKSIHSDPNLNAHPMKEKLLLDGFPKYLWRCVLRLGGLPLLEMLLDTTVMVSGFPIRNLWWYQDVPRGGVAALIAQPGVEATLVAGFGPRFVELLKASCV